MYGPTETHGACDVPSLIEQRDRVGAAAAPIGRPIANTQIYMLDRHGQPVPIGVVGRDLHRRRGRGARLSEPAGADGGALRAPIRSALTRRRGMYRTGDLGRWRADGTIEYLGRNDHR